MDVKEAIFLTEDVAFIPDEILSPLDRVLPVSPGSLGTGIMDRGKHLPYPVAGDAPARQPAMPLRTMCCGSVAGGPFAGRRPEIITYLECPEHGSIMTWLPGKTSMLESSAAKRTFASA